MKRILPFFFLAFSVLAAGSARAEPDYQGLNRSLTENVVIPAYQRMATTMQGLDDATAAFCKAPDAAGWSATVDAFNAAMDAWQHAQPIVLGPATWEGRASRVEFWPDKRGIAARQVRHALQEKDGDLLAQGGLDGKSVALQNLATYESIAFDSGERIVAGQATEEDRYACGFAAAIARFQAKLAGDILQDWIKPGGYREAVLSATAGNQYYIGADEPAAEFLKSLVGALDVAVQLKLERPLGDSIDAARPKRAESWRSARSLDNIAANLETAQVLYVAPGGFGDLLKAAGAEPLDAGLRKAFGEAIDQARLVGRPLAEAVTDKDGRKRLRALIRKLKSLRVLIAGPVADEIGLVVGFNAMDGD